MAKEWILSSPHEATPLGIKPACSATLEEPPLLQRLLAQRGIQSPAEEAEFLSPQLRHMPLPKALRGAVDAARLIVEAARAGRKIFLYGDYDVDGTTSISILWHTLRAIDADAHWYVPHRVTEGYGLSVASCAAIADRGAEMVVTTDCGITARDAAAELGRRGVPLIITDHHQWQEPLPDAAAIVHPGLDESYPNPHLCGAGVAFKLAWAMAQEISGGEKVTPELRDLLANLLPLAALGTIADMVPLRGENRIIASNGLHRLAESKFPGLVALIQTAGLTGSRLSGYDVAFKLAPRINAAGRMGHADLAVELFTTADRDRAAEIAAYLDDHNRKRQATERKITDQAMNMVAEHNLASDARRAIVVGREEWHAGVIGIVAARLVRAFHRPVVVVSFSNGRGQGSARSVEHFDLASAMRECDDDLISHGGHAMAAGLSVARDRFDAFAERFVAVANSRLTGRDLTPKLKIDTEVRLDELEVSVVEQVEQLGPFGCENPTPLLATDWLRLAAEPRCVGKTGKHLQAVFSQDGVEMKAIGFGMGDALDDLKHHRRCKVAFEPILSDWAGRRTVELRIIDFRFPGSP